jgi:hypothetical protein
VTPLGLIDQQLNEAQGERLIERQGSTAIVRRLIRQDLLDGRQFVHRDQRLIKVTLDPSLPRPGHLDGAFDDPPWRFHISSAARDWRIAIGEVQKHRADDLLLQIDGGGIVADAHIDGDLRTCRSVHEPEHRGRTGIGGGGFLDGDDDGRLPMIREGQQL